MGALGDLLINLAAALIGYMVARLAASFHRRRRTSGGRRFWAEFPERVVVVLPVWDRAVEGWASRSGVLGVGDVRALLRLQRALSDLDRRLDVAEASAFTEGAGSLVLLGGPMANTWSAEVLEHYAGALRFTFDADGTLHDGEDGESFAGVHTARGRRDAGLVVRVPNPFSRSGTVVVLAGVTGVGTDAAARLVSSDVELLDEQVQGDAAVEIAFTVDVVQGRPQTPRVRCVHPVEVLPDRRATT